MKLVVSVSLLVCVAAACGSSGGGADDALPRPDEVSTTGPTSTTTPADSNAVTESTVAPTVEIDGSTPPPPADQPGTRPGGSGGSLMAALLPDDAFPAPWEPRSRRPDQIAAGAGPNQTDCEPYWRVEELRGSGGAQMSWWIDGGNGNHRVMFAADGDLLDGLVDLALIPDQCPVVVWNEGGAFTTESIELEEGVGLKFTDRESGEITWIGVTGFDDVVSMIDVPLWTRADGKAVEFDADDLDRLVTQMHALAIRAAVAGPGGVPGTTSPTATSSPVTIVAPSTTDDVEPQIDGIGLLLLAPEDLPAGYARTDVRSHQPGDPDEELVAVCPSADSIDMLDRMFTWSASAEGPDDARFDQIIGRATDPAEASAAIRRFAEIGACDLSREFGGAEVSGGELVIEGADVAASLVVRANADGYVGETIVFAIGDVVTAISAGIDADAPLDADRANAFAALAAAKINAAR